MKEGPGIARIAGLIGEPARAEMLTALLGGRALTATELATAAGVTKQTTSAHLSKLLEAKLLTVEAQGRHRYFRLADDEVAHALEALGRRGLPQPADPAGDRPARAGAAQGAGLLRPPRRRAGRDGLQRPAGERLAGQRHRGALPERRRPGALSRPRGRRRGGSEAAARVLPPLPRLGRAPRPPRRRPRRGAAAAHLRAALGSAGERLAGGGVHRGRESRTCGRRSPDQR